jgi:hypothetical protein
MRRCPMREVTTLEPVDSGKFHLGRGRVTLPLRVRSGIDAKEASIVPGVSAASRRHRSQGGEVLEQVGYFLVVEGVQQPLGHE